MIEGAAGCREGMGRGRSDKRIAAVKRCILKPWVFRASRHALMHLQSIKKKKKKKRKERKPGKLFHPPWHTTSHILTTPCSLNISLHLAALSPSCFLALDKDVNAEFQWNSIVSNFTRNDGGKVGRKFRESLFYRVVGSWSLISRMVNIFQKQISSCQ